MMSTRFLGHSADGRALVELDAKEEKKHVVRHMELLEVEET
jgi:hypothetical protein